ncbi:MAG: extracellular solute-binding protein [Candidatus Eisenbacteria bacterium]|nr:extracellular solute-binding protein [Candidatus Eisenbacteria bacterium]
MRLAWAMARVVATAAVAGALVLAAGCGRAPGSKVTITVWEQMDPPERAQFEKHIAEFMKRDTNVVIVHQNYDTETLRTQFQTAANGGSGPEIVFGPSDQVGPFSVMGIIQPLEQVEGLGPAYFAGFEAASLDTLDGHLYYAPDQMGNHLVLIYNRRLAPRPPGTTDELIAMARRATVPGRGGAPGTYGLVLNMVEPFWLAPFLAGYGGWVMDARNQPTLDSPGMVQSLRFLSDLRTVHRVIPQECNYQVMETLFKENKAAFLVNGPWSWQGYRAAGVDFGIAPLPRVSSTGNWCAPMTASKGYSINRNCPKGSLPAVVALLKYLTGPGVQAENARALLTLPSATAAYQDSFVKSDEFLRQSRAAYSLGRRMPVVPEMRAIWDAMRPQMERVLNGQTSPDSAAKNMQAMALKQIRLMKE